MYLKILPPHSFLYHPPKGPAQSSAKLPVEQGAQQIIVTCWDLSRLAFNQAAQSRASSKKAPLRKYPEPQAQRACFGKSVDEAEKVAI